MDDEVQALKDKLLSIAENATRRKLVSGELASGELELAYEPPAPELVVLDEPVDTSTEAGELVKRERVRHDLQRQARSVQAQTKRLVASGELLMGEECAVCKCDYKKLYARNLDLHEPLNVEWLCMSCLKSVKAREGWKNRKRPKRTHEQQLAVNRERGRLWRLRKRIERDLTGQSKRRRYKGMPLEHLLNVLKRLDAVELEAGS